MGSGFKSFTAGAVLTASDMNNYLMEQSVMYFATTAARDSAITAPEDGMVAYVGSNDSSEGLYTYNGTSWRKGPGWNAPWGFVTATAGGSGGLGIVRNETNQNSLTQNAEVAMTSMTITFTAIANRFYRIVHFEPRINPTFGGNGFWVSKFRYTNTSGAIISETVISTLGTASGAPAGIRHETVTTMTAGSKVVIATGTPSLNGINAERSATAPAIFSIEDIGPSGAPA